ncbi:ATP-binding protein [Aidingimonas halophila]|uniref:histidine kinase n=1 Tax=Aidingimonas halophila TaxID=574349 RepID=A0A1H2SDR7_9GAMM|nr:ATP-binding protein [Aidingimonas halophila]GHC17789.1 two-component sensor histidine kinase [Aidingimonas halophila]SDW29750.1 two-component system, OmpR family, sensor histidine kinase BaeS [Aidingimonas halophila]
MPRSPRLGRHHEHTRLKVSRLGIKLFAVILIVNVAISALVFLAVSRSLDQGFIDYLETTQSNRAETLAEGLAEEWERRGDWQWLRDNRRAWFRLVRHQLWPGEGPPPEGIERQLGDARDFMLHDAEGRPVIGPPPRKEDDAPLILNWLPIISNGEQIGSLGYRPPQQLMARMDRIFLSRQQRNLGIIIASLALASLLLAGGLSWWLGRRTRGMAMATQRLTDGDYSIRLPERGHDELSRLSRDFNVLAETLEATREARQRWVSDIAHELRTPLAVLRGEIESMQDGIRPLDESNLRSLAQEVDQLERLVGDLRLLSQSDAGALEVSLAPIDLAEALSLRLDEAHGWLDDHGIALETRIEPSVMIRGDQQRLRQLWDNLIDNTCTYTQAPGHLSISLTTEGQRARLAWEDSTPGVPDEALVRLTERLYRVEGSRSRQSGGSGLGLSIATALVKSHGGTMSAAHSSLGGLCWILEFPLIQEPQA